MGQVKSHKKPLKKAVPQENEELVIPKIIKKIMPVADIDEVPLVSDPEVKVEDETIPEEIEAEEEAGLDGEEIDPFGDKWEQ